MVRSKRAPHMGWKCLGRRGQDVIGKQVGSSQGSEKCHAQHSGENANLEDRGKGMMMGKEVGNTEGK